MEDGRPPRFTHQATSSPSSSPASTLAVFYEPKRVQCNAMQCNVQLQQSLWTGSGVEAKASGAGVLLAMGRAPSDGTETTNERGKTERKATARSDPPCCSYNTFFYVYFVRHLPSVARSCPLPPFVLLPPSSLLLVHLDALGAAQAEVIQIAVRFVVVHPEPLSHLCVCVRVQSVSEWAP